jgi:hypothetical protein
VDCESKGSKSAMSLAFVSTEEMVGVNFELGDKARWQGWWKPVGC